MADIWSLATSLNMSSILLGLFVFLGLFWLLRRPRNLPPGPRGWPLLGYLPQMAVSADEPHKMFSKLTSRYGNVISVNFAGKLVVVLNGHKTIKEAFGQPRLSSRPRFFVNEKLDPNGIGVITSSGEVWKELRRFSLSVLKGFGVGKSSFEEKISTEAERFIDEVMKQEGAAFDPKHLLGNAVSNIICSIVFGKRFQYSDPVFQKLLIVTSDVVSEGGAGGVVELSPFLANLTFLPFVKKYIKTIRDFLSHVSALLDDAKHDFDPSNPRNFVDMFLQEIELKNKPSIKINNLRQICGDLFVAGTETTATTLRWSLLYLMAYPDVQTRIQEELDDVTSRNRFPKISDKPNLPYTQAVLCEVQRIATIVPLAIPHTNKEDTTLLGYHIPKDTIVFSNLWHNHFDPSVWEEPLQFRPERFLDKDGNFMSREELVPFGIGLRICLGEQLAKMELFVFFTLLLHGFTFKKPNDAPQISLKGINGATWGPESFNVCAIPRG